MDKINLTLTQQQLWQLDYLTGREILRLEKVVLDRLKQGKNNNKTFGDSLAFNIRLKAVLAKAKSSYDS